MLSAAQLSPISPLSAQAIPQMSHAELQVWAASLLAQLNDQAAVIHSAQQLMAAKDQELNWRQSRIDALTHEIAVLRRLKFAATSERIAREGGPEQASLWGADLDADLAAIEAAADPAPQARPRAVQNPLKIAPAGPAPGAAPTTHTSSQPSLF